MRRNSKLLLAAVLVLAPAAALAKVSPLLDTPENCVKSYFNAQKDAENSVWGEMKDYEEWELRQQKTEMGWYKDTEKREKAYKKALAKFEFEKANAGELKKYDIDVVDKKETDKSNVWVQVRIKGKHAEAKKDDETKFELKDNEDDKRDKTATQLDGKWKIKTK